MERLFIRHYGTSPSEIAPLTGSASNRQYFRLSSSEASCIGVRGVDVKENLAFVTLAGHFH